MTEAQRKLDIDADATDGDITSREFFARARDRLRFDVPPALTDASVIPASSDAGNDRMLQIVAQETPIRPAAVLIAVVAHAEPTIILTQRAAHLNDHAGQISFPGGKIDATDASPLDAALREAEEEIGLQPGCVEVLGRLHEYVTVTGYRVTPVVGLVGPSLELKLDAFEVAEVFEVPLAVLLDPANHQRNRVVWDGGDRHYYAMPYGRHYIWGATAGMLMNLYGYLTAE